MALGGRAFEKSVDWEGGILKNEITAFMRGTLMSNVLFLQRIYDKKLAMHSLEEDPTHRLSIVSPLSQPFQPPDLCKLLDQWALV